MSFKLADWGAGCLATVLTLGEKRIGVSNECSHPSTNFTTNYQRFTFGHLPPSGTIGVQVVDALFVSVCTGAATLLQMLGFIQCTAMLVGKDSYTRPHAKVA